MIQMIAVNQWISMWMQSGQGDYKLEFFRMSISGTTCVAAKIKVIFLGDPAVGKTCLISAIRNETVPLQHEVYPV